MHEFQKRIRFSGDIQPLLAQVCRDYKLGHYISYQVIPVGYEDFNLVLTTAKRKYFVKMLSARRSLENCRRYIGIMRRVLASGIQHPKLLRSSQGFLYQAKLGGIQMRLCVLEYINGKSLYDLRAHVSKKEAKFLVKQAALINQIELKPRFIYDSWAASHFLKEYREKGKYLDQRSAPIIAKFAKEFSGISFPKLPRALVHGDIIKTNVLKDTQGRLFIIDYSVANYYPRIQELAVLLCNVLFNEKRPQDAEKEREVALREYQKYIKLTNYEKEVLPLFRKVAHAMHVLQATYEKKAKKNLSKENAYWLKLGRIGLGLA